MTTCEKHSQCVVVFDGRDCPLCEAEEEIKAITALRDELAAEIEELTP